VLATVLTGSAEEWSSHAHRGMGWHPRCGRLDVNNGLLLSALSDAAFDKGLLSFDDAGRPLASPGLGADARQALGDAAPPLYGLRQAHKANLAAHRVRMGFESGRITSAIRGSVIPLQGSR
jgi:hypothetical protein